MKKSGIGHSLLALAGALGGGSSIENPWQWKSLRAWALDGLGFRTGRLRITRSKRERQERRRKKLQRRSS